MKLCIHCKHIILPRDDAFPTEPRDSVVHNYARCSRTAMLSPVNGTLQSPNTVTLCSFLRSNALGSDCGPDGRFWEPQEDPQGGTR